MVVLHLSSLSSFVLFLMTICPYCKFSSFSRRLHVVHLQEKHPREYYHNILTSRENQPIPPPPGHSNVHRKPIQSRVRSTSNFTSIPVSAANYESIASCLTQGPLPLSIPSSSMELVHNGCNTRIGITLPSGLKYELVSLRYCPGFICKFPGPPTELDDRIHDWGCRSRCSNVPCRGHPFFGSEFRFSPETSSEPTTTAPTQCPPPPCPPPRQSPPTSPRAPSTVSLTPSQDPDFWYSIGEAEEYFPIIRRDTFENSWDRWHRANINDGWE